MSDASAPLTREVALASAPGVLALGVFFGWGILANLVWTVLFGLMFDAFALHLRQRPVRARLADGGTLLCAVLLACALPPAAPWWLIAYGMGFAILIAKHLYGGHGPFNPAMVAYAALLVSFPLEMGRWLAPDGALGAQQLLLSPLGALQASLGLHDVAALDALSMASPLDVLRHEHSRMLAELPAAYPQFGTLGGKGWEWVNAGFLAGGGWLLARRIIAWQAPLGMLAALFLMAALFHDGGSSASGGAPLFHLFSGATMMGAFFIITEPSGGATTPRARLLCGALAGMLVYLIRYTGNYPDGVAFAVLLMNACAPLIDRCVRARTPKTAS